MEKYPRVDKGVQPNLASGQAIQVTDRKKIKITGVKQIDSFDSETFLLHTVMGFLIVRGTNLQLKNLNVDEGIVQISGQVNDLSYIDETNTEQQKGFFGRLFA